VGLRRLSTRNFQLFSQDEKKTLTHGSTEEDVSLLERVPKVCEVVQRIESSLFECCSRAHALLFSVSVHVDRNPLKSELLGVEGVDGRGLNVWRRLDQQMRLNPEQNKTYEENWVSELELFDSSFEHRTAESDDTRHLDGPAEAHLRVSL